MGRRCSDFCRYLPKALVLGVLTCVASLAVASLLLASACQKTAAIMELQGAEGAAEHAQLWSSRFSGFLIATSGLMLGVVVCASAVGFSGCVTEMKQSQACGCLEEPRESTYHKCQWSSAGLVFAEVMLAGWCASLFFIMALWLAAVMYVETAAGPLSDAYTATSSAVAEGLQQVGISQEWVESHLMEMDALWSSLIVQSASVSMATVYKAGLETIASQYNIPTPGLSAAASNVTGAFCPSMACVDTSLLYRLNFLVSPDCMCQPGVIQEWADLSAQAGADLWAASYAWLAMTFGLSLVIVASSSDNARFSAWRSVVFDASMDRFAFGRGEWAVGKPLAPKATTGPKPSRQMRRA